MLLLLLTQLTSFLKESKSEIKEPLYHPADSIDRQAPATTTQLIPATYTGSASPLYRHDYIYLGPVSKVKLHLVCIYNHFTDRNLYGD